MVYSMFQLSLCYAGKIYCRHRLAGVVWKPSPSQSECIWWGLCWNRGEEEFGTCWYLLLVGLEHDFVVSFPWVLGISWSQFTKSIIFQRGWNHQAGWYLLISSIFGLKSLIHWHDWPRKIATWDSSVILRILGWYTDILGEPLLDIGKRVFLLNDKWSID